MTSVRGREGTEGRRWAHGMWGRGGCGRTLGRKRQVMCLSDPLNHTPRVSLLFWSSIK